VNFDRCIALDNVLNRCCTSSHLSVFDIVGVAVRKQTRVGAHNRRNSDDEHLFIGLGTLADQKCCEQTAEP
jgi:hypothetical protein